MQNRILSNCLGVVGGAIGGAIGYYLFFWITRQGFYGLMIPGALLGFGASMLAWHRSIARGVVSGIAALALGIYTEWRWAPFRDDGGLSFFLAHLSEKGMVTLGMIAMGSVFGFWLGKDASPYFAKSDKPAAGPRGSSLED